MKALLSVIKTLIQVNIVMTVFVGLLVVAIRQQQAEITAKKQQLSYKPESFRHEITDSASPEQQQIQDSQQKIQQYQQKLKTLESQLEAYKTQTSNLNESESTLAQPYRPTPLSPQPSLQATAAPSSARPQAFLPLLPASRLTSTQYSTASRNRSMTPTSISLPSAKPTQPTLTPARLTPGNGRIFEAPNTAQSLGNRGTALARFSAWQQERSLQDEQYSTPIDTGAGLENGASEAQQSKRESFQYANDLAYGLVVAGKKGQIKYGTPTYRKVQTAMRLLRRGVSLETSAKQAKVPITVLQQLIEFGATRPGSQISLNTPIQRPQAAGGNQDKNSSIQQANDIAYGLLIAGNKGHINYGSRMYRKVQTAIRLLRRGESKERAARQANIPKSVLEQLIKWGENRPGSLADLNNEISLSD
jgi:hypothetical protein